jgi:CheY-like chemotaxis protein
VDKERTKSEAGTSGGNPVPIRLKTILLVDDDGDTRLITKWFLGCVGYVVHAFSDAEGALSQFDPKVHDLVVTDNSMAPMTGAEMAHIIKMRSPATPVLMYTGEPPHDRSCLDTVVQKPTPLPVLKEAIDKLLAAQR